MTAGMLIIVPAIAATTACVGPAQVIEWPVATSAFTATCSRSSSPVSVAFGNNHDAVYLPGSTDDEYAHYLLVAGEPGVAQLYGSTTLSGRPENWTLVDDSYFVAKEYEFDDAVLISDTHYIFENSQIFALSGDPAEGSGNWERVGDFPEEVDDVGVFYDGEVVHLLGEYGEYEEGFDGSSIAYMTSTPSFQGWELVDRQIARPISPDGTNWGVGDASVVELAGRIFMVTDIESAEVPYHIALWETDAWGHRFNFAGVIAAPSPGVDGLDNHRVQDGELVLRSDGSILMFANWRDLDGNPGRSIAALPDGTTRVVGSYLCSIN